MPSALALRRLEILAAARADPGAFLRLERERLRFALGTSLADLAVPVEIAADAGALVRGAAEEVALLLSTHHRAFVPADDLDRLILSEGYATLPAAPPRLGAGDGGPDLRGAAQLGPAIHPALTGGVISAWMGRGGRGRSLVALWIELFRRAFAEMAGDRGREPTPLLVALALGGEAAAQERALGASLPAPPLDRYLRAAALAATWLAARTGLARAWREAGRGVDDPLLARVEAALSPAAFLGGRGGVTAGGVTLYGCDLSPGVPRAEELAGRLAHGGDPDAAVAELAAAVAADGELARRAEHAVAVARLRELLGAGLAAAEAAGADGALAAARATFSAPGALAAALQGDAERKALAAELARAAPEGEARALLERAIHALRAYRPREPAAALELSRSAAREEYALAAAALLADVAVGRLAAGARRALSLRTGREAEGGAEAEWEAGRLYRLAARPGPIRCEATARPTGHLFADVKDFTRRTALLGDASMAEFLRREFYVPILAAAKAHFGGMPHLADRGGVTLNNLLGDAVSFAGRIDDMVALARAIRRQLDAYGARLAREITSEALAGRLAAVEAAHGAALRAAQAERAAAEAALARARPGAAEQGALAVRLARARSDEARLAAERDRGVARARGEVLEAGVFVSYGPAPLVVSIEDEVFGRNRVAIAERINESARGTARVASARARADALLARERARRGSEALAHAFSVFVGRPLQLEAAPELEERALSLWRAGDGPAAMRALAASVRDALEAAARGGERPGDVYNGGAALSQEALEAFLAEVGEAREVRRVELAPEEIPEALRARFWYGGEPLVLVACFGRHGRVAELFRRVGAAAFKGLGGVVVWELCAEGGGAGALAEALGAGWLRGAR